MFHPDEAVRALALASAAPGDARDFEIFALADPKARDVVPLARDLRIARGEGIGAVLAFLQSKIIDAPRARKLMENRPALLEWVKGARRRSGL